MMNLVFLAILIYLSCDAISCQLEPEPRPCSISPCKNGGTCIEKTSSTINGYRCSCLYPWPGQNCDMQRLNSLPQQNNYASFNFNEMVPNERYKKAENSLQWPNDNNWQSDNNNIQWKPNFVSTENLKNNLWLQQSINQANIGSNQNPLLLDNNRLNTANDENRIKKQNYYVGNIWPNFQNAIFPNTVNDWPSQQNIQLQQNYGANLWQPNMPNKVNPSDNPWQVTKPVQNDWRQNFNYGDNSLDKCALSPCLNGAVDYFYFYLTFTLYSNIHFQFFLI